MDPLNSTQVSTNQSNFSSVFTKQVLPSFYCIIFVVGLPLNGVAAWVFFRVPGDSGLVVYLKNMVVADLLMVFTLPFKMVHDLGLGSWNIHVIYCRFTAVLFYSSMYVGIIFIGFIGLERYIKVVRHSSSSTPSSCRSMFGGVSSLHLMQNPRFAGMLAFFTWGLLLLFIDLPNVILTSHPATEENSKKCMGLKTPLGVQWHKVSIYITLSLFWLTLFVLAFCYASIARQVYKSYQRVRRDNGDVCRKSNRSIFSILVVFFICFVPYHVCRVPYTLSQVLTLDLSRDASFLLYQLKEGTLFLSALNVCLDPVVYFLMCRNFRESLRRKLSIRRRKRSLTAGQSLSNICKEKTDDTRDKKKKFSLPVETSSCPD